MGRETIKNGVHLRFVVQFRAFSTKPLKPCTTLAIIRKQTMYIGPEDAAIGRYRALRMSVDVRKREIARYARRFADMHFIAG